MALSSDDTWNAYKTKGVQHQSPRALVVKSAAVLYNGSLCSHDTTTGAIKPYDGTVTDRLVGWHFGESVTGNASGTVKGRIFSGGFKALIPVTGLETTVATDYGKPVYASDDGTYTLTGTTATHHVGRVEPDNNGVTAGTTAWVKMRDVDGNVGGN